MSEIADRYRRVAAAFTATVDAVPGDAWDNPAPCEGWTARDVVGHLVDWMPSFFIHAPGVVFGAAPPAAQDPKAAWAALDAGLQAALDDPAVAGREIDSPVGRRTVERLVDEFMTGDVLIHTWDLARATGTNERLDADEVHRQLEAMAPFDDALRRSGHYGPKVDVPAHADGQTRLLAFTGRRP